MCVIVQETIGEEIKKFRKNKRLSQKELGSLIGLSNTYICDIEVGRTTPSLKLLLKIFNVLEVSIVGVQK
ncbi:helix-turn-helix transcriptional regulator [Proteiniclasticum sp.]|uniref:helix-turn-helix domain-containing protein n=1 Tax=Proteiniclasticum sp. TaxID=2053595 RepID=UPI002898847D|nr:helix-turn-helix transcriptional regulator [Proteiniclasticum sp.]